MSFRKKFIQKFLLMILNVFTFYFAFWIFWDIGMKTPWQLVLLGNLFNMMVLLILIVFQCVLALAIENPEVKNWLLTIERKPNPKSKKLKKAKSRGFM